MTLKDIQLTREEYNPIAKNRCIQELQNMSTEELLNTLSRYDSRRKVKNNRKKLLKIGLGKIAKIQNISKTELNQAEKLQRKSIDELQEIAKLKNTQKLTKEELIIALLKSENSVAERNFEKHFNNNTNYDTYDDKIRSKISDIKLIFSRLGNIVTNNDRRKIKTELYEIEKKKNLSDKEKEEIYDNLIELVNTLNEKEKYKHHDRDDLDYNAIRYIENLFNDDNDNVDDYYKPILFEK